MHNVFKCYFCTAFFLKVIIALTSGALEPRGKPKAHIFVMLLLIFNRAYMFVTAGGHDARGRHRLVGGGML